MEDSESAALLGCECEESEIFSESNVRRYMTIQPLVIQVKASWVNLALKCNRASACYFIYLASNSLGRQVSDLGWVCV